MQIWVIYDIESSKNGDKRRRKIVKEIEKFGLYRVQKSVFCGSIDNNRLEELKLFSEGVADPKLDKVYIFPMCQTDYDNVIMIGQPFDKDLVSDEKSELFF
ncbi:MAG: CRISPR-associated endonuclease Cas2 [Candidatus Delongbacteria bacterium]|nr:CRISPR-associated endonuclease Cas2 [Candidatus Delongbacteria bacterium]MBN2834269.1 CRISPR-associated endonuclease Cas2 [Candidatus Delongbacteria bacterium]